MSESVAIVEKKPHRPGGCAGIFFQLFDWNRRFAKKKFFSKKLLPPAQPKQCERKFGRDEKLPKLRLIANENIGGFMNMKKNGSNKNSKQKQPMRSPSLVARLMGLESMPAAQKNKSSKETTVLQTDNAEEKYVRTQNVFGFNSEKENGNEKHELRPQKAQKTDSFERRVLTKFKSDVFQYQNLLLRSRKHHRTKLVSPLKNPKTSSWKTSSRLIDVASRILEPGFQNPNRAKSAITYSNNSNCSTGNSDTFVMERKMASQDIPESSEFPTDFMPNSACKHCGNQLEKSNPTSNFEEKVAPFSSSIPIYLNNNEEIKRSSSVPSSIGLKNKTLRQSQVSMVADRVPHQRQRASSATNDFDHSGKRLPTRVDYIARKEENSYRVRKRRCDMVGEKEIRLDSHSFESTNRGSSTRRDVKGINVTTPLKQKNDTRNRSYKSSSSDNSDVNGDEMGAILQQKLKELSSLEDDELSRGDEPKRTTAVILQELIFALSAEKSMLCDNVAVEYGEKIEISYRSTQLPIKRYIFEAKQKTARTLLGYLPEDEHPSPGSVLEASFSNESCLSSNFGDRSEIYYDPLLKSESDLITRVSEVLLSLGFAKTGLKQSKLAYAKDVILNLELISKNASQSSSLLHFLIYELENLATKMLPEYGSLLDFEDKKHEKQFKEFVFDCVIEYLDSKYGRYTTCGFVEWTKMPLCSIANELVDEVRRWMGFGESSLDEIIDFEMSHSYGKWNDFGIEEYEIGAEINKEVLQVLVDEIVVDLFEGKVCCEWI